MLRKAFYRALIGFPLGVFLSHTINLIIMLMRGQGTYSPVAPSFAAEVGSELNAVLLQYMLSGLLGTALAAGSVVWENESWSILRRTVVHLLITSVSMFPVAYINHWMPRSPLGVAIYVLIFVVTYGVIWGVQWMFWNRRVCEINARLSGK